MRSPWLKTCPAIMFLQLLFILAQLTAAQIPRLQPQTNTFNSTFALSSVQIASLNLSDTAANNINIAARFERTNWATGSVLSDTFYVDLPDNATTAPSGSILKVEHFTDTSRYTIAPGLALSRIVYQSKTLDGTLVPVSAYILWPYLPRGGSKVAPLVTWGHGTSGIMPECAPSHVRNLWYQFSGPYALALAGYAVVATDYAGLGVARFPDGSPIIHQYLASPAAGNDLLYAAQAAKAAFPDKLSRDFVVMGHSQGGGAAWAAAQQQMEARVPGYLGAIAASPNIDAVATAKATPEGAVGLLMAAKSIESLNPGLKISDILTETGIAALKLLEQIQGCNSVASELITNLLASSRSPTVLVKPEILQSPYAQSWSNMSSVGDKFYEGPLLVLQGTNDGATPEIFTSMAVNKTCQERPGQYIEYVVAEGVDHVPIMYATQQVWMDWLDIRFGFKGEKLRRCGGKCSVQRIGLTAPRPLNQYQGPSNYVLSIAMDGYQVA